MKKLSIILTCALLAIFSGSAFAEKKDIGMYAKLGIGYASLSYDSTSMAHFEIAPVFGITNLVPVPHFAFEAFCNLDFGGKKESFVNIQSTVIAPGARAVWAPPISFFSKKTGTWQDKLIPYAGAGFSVPIAFWKVETDIPFFGTKKIENNKVYFDLETQLGCRWAFNEHWAVLAENNLCFGGIFKYSFIAGGIYTF